MSQGVASVAHDILAGAKTSFQTSPTLGMAQYRQGSTSGLQNPLSAQPGHLGSAVANAQLGASDHSGAAGHGISSSSDGSPRLSSTATHPSPPPTKHAPYDALDNIKGMITDTVGESFLLKAAHQDLLKALGNARPEDLMNVEIIEALPALLVAPGQDKGQEKQLKKAILGFANLIKMTADAEVRPDFVKSKNADLSNNVKKNNNRLRPGMSIYATCIEPMANRQTKPYHETYVSTPGPTVICKRYCNLVYKIEGDRIRTLRYMTKEGNGMKAVDSDMLHRYGTCMKAGGDTSRREGGAPLVQTSSNEPEYAMICTIERNVYMGDYIEIADRQVTKDSLVRIVDYLLAAGSIAEKDAKEILEVNGVTEALVDQYREIGVPEPGEILVEKAGAVC
ncbi:hypothetical protein M409DRAFT_19494 [Zasmidium cellare ATCC 36951]|uniref:Uncharacterized protein n=1 Tax=Zasmidium cellare ATCC 36951 TaxID=1080233 RepID=A0A6A6CWU7_ZASCE|nr:uncharacterized protein M409DRAFT_19494 [Zasmidium cellare ATCC 36951]KAF2170678.1 hypothetical protein M409DRAFT_19494 [Zasmidium cellare ATCC 36951]